MATSCFVKGDKENAYFSIIITYVIILKQEKKTNSGYKHFCYFVLFLLFVTKNVCNRCLLSFPVEIEMAKGQKYL